MPRIRWTAADIPDQHGRTIVITGANTGLGFELSAALAVRGAHVVLACRSTDRATTAVEAIRSRCSEAELSTVALDVASLESVREAAEQLVRPGPPPY